MTSTVDGGVRALLPTYTDVDVDTAPPPPPDSDAAVRQAMCACLVAVLDAPAPAKIGTSNRIMQWATFTGILCVLMMFGGPVVSALVCSQHDPLPCPSLDPAWRVYGWVVVVGVVGVLAAMTMAGVIVGNRQLHTHAAAAWAAAEHDASRLLWEHPGMYRVAQAWLTAADISRPPPLSITGATLAARWPDWQARVDVLFAQHPAVLAQAQTDPVRARRDAAIATLSRAYWTLFLAP